MKKQFTLSRIFIILFILFIFSFYLISKDSHPFIGCNSKTDEVTLKDTVVSWKYPEVSSIADNEEGKMIKLGRNIFTETYKYIGPDVKDTSKRFLSNNMDCQNCHFNAGTVKNVLGLVGTYSDYPAFDPRSDKIISIKDRVNNCMTRSMNGKSLPENSSELNAIAEYLKWLSTYIPKGKKTEGNGLPKIKLLDKAADPVKGSTVFLNKCMTCHAENGSGVLAKPGNVEVAADSLLGYSFPPVMGNNSYNDGAGMYRLLTAASFIYNKMPLNSTGLSIEESYDVAAYINSQPRATTDKVKSDYPDLKLKPVDFPFPLFDDNFSEDQHKYGPYLPMMENKETSKEIDPGSPLKK